MLVLRLVCLGKCGRFYEPEQRDKPEPCARAVRYSVGRAVRTHRATVTPSLCSTSSNSMDVPLQESYIICACKDHSVGTLQCIILLFWITVHG
jgi:hypothetical protein